MESSNEHLGPSSPAKSSSVVDQSQIKQEPSTETLEEEEENEKPIDNSLQSTETTDIKPNLSTNDGIVVEQSSNDLSTPVIPSEQPNSTSQIPSVSIPPLNNSLNTSTISESTASSRSTSRTNSETKTDTTKVNIEQSLFTSLFRKSLFRLFRQELRKIITSIFPQRIPQTITME